MALLVVVVVVVLLVLLCIVMCNCSTQYFLPQQQQRSADKQLAVTEFGQRADWHDSKEMVSSSVE